MMRQRDGGGRRGPGRVAIWPILALAALAAGCSSGPLSSSFSSVFGSSGATTQQTSGPVADPNLDCPTIDVRSGASTLQVVALKGDANANSLRYQVVIARSARECALLGATMTVKVGVQGRVILGPAGGPGQIEVPLRFALVEEGPTPKSLWTKLQRIPVTIPPGETNVPFTYVEQDLTFPIPPGGDISSYLIYIGFDQGAPKEPPKKAKSRRAR